MGPVSSVELPVTALFLQMGLFWTLGVIIAVGTAAASLTLLLVYLRNFRRIRSVFAMGLSAFALILFVQNVMAIYDYIVMSQKFKADVAIPMLSINGLEFVAVLVLLAVTLR